MTTNSIQNDYASLHPTRSTASAINSNGKERLHSFLDTFTASDEAYSTSGHARYTATGDRSQPYASGLVATSPPSPTPVLLSPPYLRNIAVEQQQQPIHRKRSNTKGMGDDMNATTTDNNKKHRVLLEDPSTPLLDYFTHPPSPFTKENNAMDPPSAIKDATPPPPPASPSPSSTAKPKGSGRGRKPVQQLLSEDQKKANHIASEQKRRANIRIGFDQLVDIVPNLNDCQRSESLILQKSADYIRQLVDTKNGLRDRVRELQTALGEVPDEDSSEGEMDYGF